MSRYETGVHEPPYKTVEDIASVLGLPTAYFYCDDDDLAVVIKYWARLSKADRSVILERIK